MTEPHFNAPTRPDKPPSLPNRTPIFLFASTKPATARRRSAAGLTTSVPGTIPTPLEKARPAVQALSVENRRLLLAESNAEAQRGFTRE